MNGNKSSSEKGQPSYVSVWQKRPEDLQLIPATLISAIRIVLGGARERKAQHYFALGNIGRSSLLLCSHAREAMFSCHNEVAMGSKDDLLRNNGTPCARSALRLYRIFFCKREQSLWHNEAVRIRWGRCNLTFGKTNIKLI